MDYEDEEKNDAVSPVSLTTLKSVQWGIFTLNADPVCRFLNLSRHVWELGRENSHTCVSHLISDVVIV